MNLFLARYLTLSLSLGEKIGMIFFPLTHLNLNENWKAYFNCTALTFIRHIVCAFLVICKYGSKQCIKRNRYFTGFT